MLLTSPAELMLPPNHPLIGLDVGEKTIGIAASDASRLIASPLHTIRRGKFTQDAQEIAKIAQARQVAAIIIGYPVNMDGSLGPRTQSIRQFALNLEKHLNLPMVLWDERLSTVAVTRAMLEGDLSRAKRAELVDKMAATYILQGVLDFLARNPA